MLQWHTQLNSGDERWRIPVEPIGDERFAMHTLGPVEAARLKAVAEARACASTLNRGEPLLRGHHTYRRLI